MTPDERDSFEKKIYAFIGCQDGPPKKGCDAVNLAMIRHWSKVMGDKNPVYFNETISQLSKKGQIIAPPAMLQAWIMDDMPHANTSDTIPQRELHDLFDSYGFIGVLGTNSTMEFYKDLYIGDEVTAVTTIDSISEQKATARGIGYFIDTSSLFSNQLGIQIGKQKFRVLKFIPAQNIKGNESSTIEKNIKPKRIIAPRGHDNEWWWKGVDDGKVFIQRCKSCQTLRHPPRPMCGGCQSTQWDYIESTLEGYVFSFTILHHPKIPGYQYPLCCAVIQLNEGTRIVSNVIGIDVDQVAIGMKVKGRVEQIDDETRLPQFYPLGIE